VEPNKTKKPDRTHEEQVQPSRRPPTRSEVDDFAEGPREHGSNRGGFVSEHSDANPGGTAGEHSGQRTPKDK
jgi:hypothetical protein